MNEYDEQESRLIDRTRNLEMNADIITVDQIKIALGYLDLNQHQRTELYQHLQDFKAENNLEPLNESTPALALTANTVSDFIDGQTDCRDGNQAKPDGTEAYLQGYNVQYEFEQILINQSEGREQK